MIGTLVLAGGLSARMGSPKPLLERDGVTLLEAVLRACPPGAVVVVGPPELSALDLRGARLTREDPPGGGPVAAIEAGLAALEPSADTVQLLACDLPQAAEIIHRLDETTWTTAALVPLDEEGVPQFLAGRYRREALRAAIPKTSNGAAVRRALAVLARTEVRLPDAVLLDLDDPASARAAGYVPGPQPGGS